MHARPWEETNGRGNPTHVVGADGIPLDWRERAEGALGLLRQHPATLEQLVEAGHFASYATAARWVQRAAEREKLKFIGYVKWGGGQRKVFCGWRPKLNQLLHEVLLTQFLLPFLHLEIRRGKYVKKRLNPDATILGEPVVHVELDRDTEGYRQAKRRMQVYKNCPDLVVWVAPTMARMEGLRQRAAVIEQTALFTVLGSDEWLTYGGEVFKPFE